MQTGGSATLQQQIDLLDFSNVVFKPATLSSLKRNPRNPNTLSVNTLDGMPTLPSGVNTAISHEYLPAGTINADIEFIFDLNGEQATKAIKL